MSEQIDSKTEILKFADSDPFVPFVIVMTRGDRYEVTDPHAAAIGQHAVIAVPPKGSGHSVLRLNQISSLEALEPA
jgi:hypothetical protein